MLIDPLYVFQHSFPHISLKQERTVTIASGAHPNSPLLPIIRHLHFLGPILHRSFQNLSRRFGPLILLHIGASTCVVASSAAVVKEIIGTHENIFSSRPEFGLVDFYIYKESRFVTAEYGSYWRFMRKICMTKLLSGTQLNKCTDIRQQEIRRLLESLTKSYEEGKPIDISSLVTTMTNNIICRIVMSTRCSDSCDEAEEIKKFVKETLKLGGLLSRRRVGSFIEV
ncbi:hypothetical protein IFM89_017570 [Coptis chinensis]|uniref:Cytochrome P450 n=1 Tax=Coptis chinensis TaxID=261450 RepID=A0A835HTN4_9MAGN|nr:hypothetical protein IFM89_017570 [Coptis chinensis]